MAKTNVLEFLSVPATLPSEYRILTQTGAEPRRDSQKYLQLVEVDGDRVPFNANANDAPAIQTKNVTVSGLTVVLEDASAYPHFGRINKRTDIKNLAICADEVVIRSPLILPGTSVTIHARSLRFDGNGSITTTPVSVGARANQPYANGGARGGSIYLYVKTIDAAGSAIRLITNGANGQAAQLGEKGADGASVPAWNGKLGTKTIYGGNEELNWEPDFRGKTNGHTPIFAYLQEYDLGKAYPYNWFKVGSASEHGHGWPGNGSPPKLKPGTPGRGGAGGDVYSRFADLLKPRTEQKPGQGGERAIRLDAARAGEPVKSCQVHVGYVTAGLPHFKGGEGNGILNRKAPSNEFKMGDTHESQGYPAVEPPGPPEADRAGQQLPLNRTDDAFWLHALTLQALIGYLRDAWRAGQTKAIRATVDEYLTTLVALDDYLAKLAAQQPDFKPNPGASHLPIEYLQLQSELRALVLQVDSPLDYFGHPAGWVPVLSFESNLAAFQRETDDAIARLYLSYWMENNQAAAEARAQSIHTTLEQLRKETQAAIDTYNAADTRLATLNADYTALCGQITGFVTQVEVLEKEIKRVTKYTLEGEKFLRASGKILGGIAQVVPVGQPALGAFGKGLTVLADWDVDEPFDSVKKIGSAVWDTKLVSDVLIPKVKHGASTLLSISQDSEKTKDDFTKEVEKQELSEKAKKHIKGQSDAKEQITKALGSFAVSKDELDAALEKALAASPEFKNLSAELKKLNASKMLFAEQLLAIGQVIDEASATIVNNRLTGIELRAALATSLKGMSPEGLRYTRAMGQRALERLQRYEYYFVKSYNYLWLETIQNFDTNTEYIFNELKRTLQPQSAALLTGKQFEQIGVVFRENLKSVADRVLTFYNTVLPTGSGENVKTKFTLELSQKQLDTLNSDAKAVVINPMEEGKIHLSLEDVRIFEVNVVHAELLDPPTKSVNVRLRVKHPGDSTLRRNGKLYLFRNTARNWGTLVTHSSGKTTLEPQGPDPMDESLIKFLIGQSASKSPLRSRPSAWSPLVLERELMDMISQYPAKFRAITLEVQYTARDIDPNQISLFVSVPRPLQPLITCSVADLNGHANGEGSIMRTYHKSTNEVTLSAPVNYGEYVFVGWRSRDGRGGGDSTQMMPLLTPEAAEMLGNLGDLMRTNKLTVSLDTHRLVEAVFLQRAPFRSTPG